MIEFLKDWVLNIVTITVFIMLIEILVPSGKMKKAVSLVTGLVLVIALINPVLGLVKKGINLKEFQIAGSNYIDKREIMINSEVLKENQIKQITNVYRKKVINQLEDVAKNVEGVIDAKADVIINEDYDSSDFGDIKKVYLILTLEDSNKNVKPIVKINKIKIGRTNPEMDTEFSEGGEVDKNIRVQIENKIENLFSIQKENIVMSLYEKQGG